MLITLEEPSQQFAVNALTYRAFETMVLPGRTHTDEHYLAHILRQHRDFIPELNFVGTLNNEVIANIMYAKGYVKTADGLNLPTINFGPLSVLPKYHNKGYGGELLKYSLDKAKALGYGGVIIFGHPNYYKRFGFSPANSFGITLPDGSSFEAFMALELVEGYFAKGGIAHLSPAYDINEDDFKAWHKGFMERLL